MAKAERDAIRQTYAGMFGAACLELAIKSRKSAAWMTEAIANERVSRARCAGIRDQQVKPNRNLTARQASRQAMGPEWEEQTDTQAERPDWIPTSPQYRDRQAANDRIRRAAHGLLMACEEALQFLVDTQADQGETGRHLRAAIALARGPQQ